MATSSTKQKISPTAMAKNQPNKVSQAVKAVLAVLVIVGASIAGTMFYNDRMGNGSANAESAIQQPVILPNPVFSPLEPFTVTLNDEMGGRVLYVAITLRVNNEASQKII